MVYKRVRGWTSGRSLPVLKFVQYPPGTWGRCRLSDDVDLGTSGLEDNVDFGTCGLGDECT